MSRTESFVTHISAANAALNEMQQELAVEPLHPNADRQTDAERDRADRNSWP